MKHLPILVTGAHRSGSTWIGRMIALASNVRYVHEPFNLDRENSPFTYWFEYVSSDSERKYQNKVKSYIYSFYNTSLNTIFKNLKKIRNVKNAYSFLLDVRDRLTKRTLLKDPIAVMSAEWLFQSINCKVIIVIRHPAAFVASLKVKGWDYEFNNYLEQSQLMADYLNDYRIDIEEFSKGDKDIIEQGILLWNTIYSTVLKYMIRYKAEWYFVKHEDVSRNSIIEFNKMFSYLDLEFTKDIEEKIIQTSFANDETELIRNSARNIKTWKERLSLEEIEMIKKGTYSIWIEYYNEKDWD